MFKNMKAGFNNGAQSQVFRFLVSQFTHTIVTVAIVAILFVGAAQVGALNSVFAPVLETMGTSFTMINYQGRLSDSAGNPVDTTGAPDGLSVTFALYETETGGTPLWSETHANVPVSEGLFNVKLGSVNPFSISLLGDDLWLGVQVGNDDEMVPRVELSAVPYAMVAGEVINVSSLNASDGEPREALIVDEEGNVGIGTSEPSNQLHIAGGGLDIGEGRNADSAQDGLNIRSKSTPNIQLTTISHSASHGVLFGAYKKSSGVSGSLFASGNTAYANDVGDYGGGAGAIGFYGNGGHMNFYISPFSTGQDTDIDWGDPKMAIHRNGDVEVAGNFTASGTKSAVVETENYGARKLYAFEQATNRFADEGIATLQNGSARIALDPIFLETVAEDFHVHITPYGDANLYVSEIGADYFVVESQEAGAEVGFSWLLTAARSGYEDVRLEQVLEP